MRASPALTASPAPMCSAPETEHLERLAVLADAALAVDDGARRLEADRDRAGRDQRRADDERGGGDDDVEEARDQRVPSAFSHSAGVPVRR
jgi:hypothetical protein